MKEQNIAKIVARLLPASIDWLVAKGYVERSIEDNAPVIRITDKGFRYFATIEAGRKDAI